MIDTVSSQEEKATSSKPIVFILKAPRMYKISVRNSVWTKVVDQSTDKHCYRGAMSPP